MSDNPAPTAVFTRKETARRLRVCVASLDNMVRENRGPAPTRIGRRVVFTEPAIDKFLAERTIGALNEAPDPEIIAEEIEMILGSDPDIKSLAELASSLRRFDKNIRAGYFEPADARTFLRAIRLTFKVLHLIAKRQPIDGLLITEIADAASQTARDVFPGMSVENVR